MKKIVVVIVYVVCERDFVSTCMYYDMRKPVSVYILIYIAALLFLPSKILTV